MAKSYKNDNFDELANKINWGALKLIRIAGGIKQSQLAKAINMKRQNISHLESGRSPAKKEDTIKYMVFLLSNGFTVEDIGSALTSYMKMEMITMEQAIQDLKKTLPPDSHN